MVMFLPANATFRRLAFSDFRTRTSDEVHARPHLSTRQYSRLVHRWVDSIGLESISYGTHSMRRTKATQIYRPSIPNGQFRNEYRLL
jgi:hypothetical protein